MKLSFFASHSLEVIQKSTFKSNTILNHLLLIVIKMVVKIYISGISASKEVKKRQQRAQFILDSCKINYEKIDITEPEFEEEKLRMKEVCKKRNDQTASPPQFFNDDDYCGDWFDFEVASEEDLLLEFLKLKEPSTETVDQDAGEKIGSSNGNKESTENDETVNVAADETGTAKSEEDVNQEEKDKQGKDDKDMEEDVKSPEEDVKSPEEDVKSPEEEVLINGGIENADGIDDNEVVENVSNDEKVTREEDSKDINENQDEEGQEEKKDSSED